MKNILYVLFSVILLLFYSCTKKIIRAINSDSTYLIKKIYKKNSWYIIYAERNDTLYKIVSMDDDSIKNKYEKIIIGKRYDFNLHSKKENAPTIGGVKLAPVGYTGCYEFDNKTIICLEPKKGIYDLYITESLRGLCFIK